MVSEYQYIAVADLESYAGGIDYEVTYANYTDTVVEAKITQAERWVNEYCGQTFTASAAPDGVEFATLEMAQYLMNKQMYVDGYLDKDKKLLPLSHILQLCKTPLEKNKVSISYSSSSTDFDLRTLKD